MGFIKNKIQPIWNGLLATAVVTLASTFISEHYGGPVMLYALLFGIAFNFLSEIPSCKPGIELSSSSILRIGVACLGVRLSIHHIQEMGVYPLFIVVSGVILTITLGYILSKKLDCGRDFGLLSGGSVSICGASAAMALSALFPKNKTQQRDTILTVAVVTSLSTIAMITYPLIVSLLNLDPSDSALFIGGTIHDVAQVVGAGYMISTDVGDAATYVKLLRVSLLSPVVVIISLMVQKRSESQSSLLKNIRLPFFLIMFFILMGVNSMNILPGSAINALNLISRWGLVMAIAGLGMKTSLKDIVAAGWKPTLIITLETLFLASFILGAISVI